MSRRAWRASSASGGVYNDSSLFLVPGAAGPYPHGLAGLSVVKHQTQARIIVGVPVRGRVQCTVYFFVTLFFFFFWSCKIGSIFLYLCLGCLSLFMQLSLPGISSFLPTIYLNHSCFQGPNQAWAPPHTALCDYPRANETFPYLNHDSS